jgi:hypothetical protein
LKALRIAILVILSLLEIGLIASGGSNTLPYRQAELHAFRAYMQDTTSVAKQRAWEEERSRSRREILITRVVEGRRS